MEVRKDCRVGYHSHCTGLLMLEVRSRRTVMLAPDCTKIAALPMLLVWPCITGASCWVMGLPAEFTSTHERGHLM